MNTAPQPQIDTDEARQLAAQRIQQALDDIAEAQRLVAHAAAMLCPVVGGIATWNRVGKMQDTLKRLWYNVRALRQRPRPVQVDAGHLAWKRANPESWEREVHG